MHRDFDQEYASEKTILQRLKTIFCRVLLLLDYDLLSVVDVQSFGCGLAIEATAVEGVPGVGESSVVASIAEGVVLQSDFEAFDACCSRILVEPLEYLAVGAQGAEE